MEMVMQRTEVDCGCAAVASLCRVSYEEAAKAWVNTWGRPPHSSSYRHLLKVIEQLGFSGERVNSAHMCIRFVRERPRMKSGHWVVTIGDGLWCPTSGWYQLKSDYPWKHFGRGIALK